MHRGYWQFWRKWQEHELAKDPNASHLFLHMCCRACVVTQTNRRYGYVLQAGQIDSTIKQLSHVSGLSVKEVRGGLKRLEKYGTIKRSCISGRVPAITSILNWDTYKQGGEKRAGKGQVRGRLGAGKGQVEKHMFGDEKKPNKTVDIVIDSELLQFESAIHKWLKYKREKGQKYKPVGLKGLWKRMKDLGDSLPDAIDNSIANNWAGLFGSNGSKVAKRGYNAGQTDEYRNLI